VFEGGLKDIDIKCKFLSLHLSWIKRLFDNNFHPWKNIPLELLKQAYGVEVFFSNTVLEPPENLPTFYKKMIEAWNNLEQNPETPDLILRQSVWFNRFIKIGNKPVKNFIEKNIFISDLFKVNGQIKPWNTRPTI
jgi:hypothetical protein